MEEYRFFLYQLVYHIRLYDGFVGEMMLVTQFIMGLKDELKGAVEVYLPDIVSKMTIFAQL